MLSNVQFRGQGWHMCQKAFPVKMDESFKSQVQRCSAYLARLYAILQQSSVQLNCFAGKRGKKYREWLEEVGLLSTLCVCVYVCVYVWSTAWQKVLGVA